MSYYPSNYYCDKSTLIAVKMFFGNHNITNAIAYIADKNIDSKTYKHKCKLNKIRESIDNNMLEIRALPKAIDNWIEKTLLKDCSYIFYEYKPKKIVKGYCTYCKTDIEINRPTHKSKGSCPHCKTQVTFLSLNKYHITNGFKNVKRVGYLQSVKAGFVLRGYTVTQNFDGCSNKPTVTKEEAYRVFYNLDIVKGYLIGKMYEYGEFRNTGEYRFYECRDNYYLRIPMNLYPTNLNEILKKYVTPKNKHIDYNKIAQKCGNIYFEKFIYYTIKYESFENIFKSGLYNICRDIMNGCSTYDFKLHSSNIKKALGINRDELAVLKKLNPNLKLLKLYQLVKLKEKAVNIDKLNQYFKLELSDEWLKYGTLHNVLGYYFFRSKRMSMYSVVQMEIIS